MGSNDANAKRQQGQRPDSTKSKPILIKGGDTTENTAPATEKPTASDTLAAPPGWPKPMGNAALHGLAGDVVKLIEPQTEADPAALLINFLVAFGNAVGRRHYMKVDGAHHYTNLFAVVVGKSSKARKGTSWARTREALPEAMEEWKKSRIKSGLSSGEGIIHNVRDQVKKETEDGETEVIDEGVKDKRLLVFEGEFASVLKVIQRDGNTLSATLRNAWDTGDMSMMVRHNPDVATGAHISIVGNITTDELRSHLSATESTNGLGNRILWICAKRSKLLHLGGGDLDKDKLVDLRGSIHTAYSWSVDAKDEHEFKLDSPAEEKWKAAYEEMSKEKPGMVGSLIARDEAQGLRLAQLYARLDRSWKIQLPHIEAALEVLRYSDESVQYIFGDRTGDPVVDRIWFALRDAPRGLTRTQINALFDHHLPKVKIEIALETLEGLSKARKEKQNSGGRPTETWFAVEEKKAEASK